MTEDHQTPREDLSGARPMQEPRPRTERRDRGAILLTERDEATLRWIGEQYAVRLDHLQVL